MHDIDLVIIGEDTPRDELEEALHFLNEEAKKTHPSPRYDNLHATINAILDLLAGR
jgi:hypothetical protein